MIQPTKEKPIVAQSPFDVTLLSRVFLGVLSLAVALTAIFRFGPAQVREIFHTEESKSVLIWLLRWLDLGWAMCALFAAYWCCVIEEGLRLARRVTLVALAVTLACLILQVISGFGANLRFTDEFGSRLPGGIPIGIILLWTSLLLAIRSTLGKFGRLWPIWINIAVAALAAAFIAWTIEFWMAKLRGWWLWTAPADPKKMVSFGWSAIALWAVAAGAYVALAPRSFQSRDTNGGWIILVFIAMVPLLIGICRGLAAA